MITLVIQMMCAREALMLDCRGHNSLSMVGDGRNARRTLGNKRRKRRKTVGIVKMIQVSRETCFAMSYRRLRVSEKGKAREDI